MRDYKVKELMTKSLEEAQDLITLAKHIRPDPESNRVFRMTFVEVNNLKELLGDLDNNENPLKVVGMVQGLNQEQVLNLRVTKYFGYLNSIVEQMRDILEAEANGLKSEYTDFKWEAVGGSKRLEKYGYYNTLEQLSGGDILKWDKIRQLPYNEVFLKLLRDKDMADIEREMNEIKPLTQ